MTEEDFLKRWSRRKREADTAKTVPPEAEPRAIDSAVPERVVLTSDADAPQAEFDPASLPPIESITAVSDITAFLRAGVPVELTHAALRRVWTADPAIRNFVGLAENAWDFTDPTAMPGFGPLESTDEVRRMIAQVIDQIDKAARPQVSKAPGADSQVTENTTDSSAVTIADQTHDRSGQIESVPDQTAETAAEKLNNEVLLQSNKDDDAAQREIPEGTKKPKQLSQRIHGTALPR